MPKQKRTQSRQRELYRVRNWSEYEKALVQRGSITFWLSADFERTWLYKGEKQRGSQFDYSDKAIEIMQTWSYPVSVDRWRLGAMGYEAVQLRTGLMKCS